MDRACHRIDCGASALRASGRRRMVQVGEAENQRARCGGMNAEIMGPDILLVMLFFIPLVLGIWVAVDAGGKPDAAFERAGTSKTLWIVLPIVGIFICVMSV